MIVSIIVAMDEGNGIGKDNALLCHLPNDLKWFKQNTLHKPVLMGRKTFESIGRPLPNRRNIVVSRSKNIFPEGISCFTSLQEAITDVKDCAEVMVIGGAEIYVQTLPDAQRLYLTRIHHKFEADVFFSDIDLSEWKLVQEEHQEADEKNIYAHTFQIFERK